MVNDATTYEVESFTAISVLCLDIAEHQPDSISVNGFKVTWIWSHLTRGRNGDKTDHMDLKARHP